eukprot:TRINITY_DN4344_c0_g1_i2.p1 TRINITY_DN4344_c0_g1~~TRINITY_DN4344_c0_g1_i2.p1  ORF type:complete len:254 (+),score=34.41 TRINITY_DN4344_c0_g1_i2:761-1522(+)
MLFKKKSQVWTDNGLYCPENTQYRMLDDTTLESNNSNDNSSDTIATQIPEIEEDSTQYFIVLPDYFSSSDNTEQLVKTLLSSTTFTTNLLKRSNTQNLAITNTTVEYFDITTNIPQLAYEPITVLTSSTFEIYFNLSNKNGFFYCGIVGIQSNLSSTVTQGPTTKELFTGKEFNFTGHQVAFAKKMRTQKLTFTNLDSENLDYKYWYLVTSENPYNLQASTQVQGGGLATIRSDTKLALILNYTFIISILLLF